MEWRHKDLISLEGWTREELHFFLEQADYMEELMNRPIKKVPALRGKMVVNCFFENSTRTRVSFELAEKMLSADVVNWSASGSSTSKGETLRDTVWTLEAMGADAVVNTKKQDLEQAVMEFTAGEGINVAMEATGVIPVLELIIAKLMSPAGKVVVLGFPVEPAKIAPADIMKRELDIKGSRLNNKKFPEVIQWLAEKRIEPAGLVSHVMPYTDVERGMDLFSNHPEEVCKIILTFDEK